MSALVVRVPASSANLGAGFDVLGMALDLSADLGVGVAPGDALQLDEHHPATVAHRSSGGTGPIWLRSAIPMGRGLGFSGAMRVGGSSLAVAARGPDPVEALRRGADEILDVAVGLEGHGDNAAASFWGGIIAWTPGGAVPLRIGPRLRAARVVVWIPAATTSTDRSRASLPAAIDRADGVHNLASVVRFTAAIERDDPDLLVGATDDRMHQAARLAALPGAADALSAGVAAGAWCGWLSGSGPSIAFLCADGDLDAVRGAVPDEGHCKTLAIAPSGAQVLAATTR